MTVRPVHVDRKARRLCAVAFVALALAVPIAPDIAAAADPMGRDTIIQKLAPPPPGAPKTRGLMVVPSVDLDVKFEFNSDKLTPDAVRQLGELGAALSSDTLRTFKFEIAGHTDAVGAADYNQRLSERRSAAVKGFMVERFGIDPGRLTTVGWGYKKLKNPSDPTGGENRRVEIVNLGN